MKVILTTEALMKASLSFEEASALVLLYHQVSAQEYNTFVAPILYQLDLDKLVITDFDGKFLNITKKGMEKLAILGYHSNIHDLASKFILLFPEGVKSGGYYVRSDLDSVKNKLKEFRTKYPHITEERILLATEKYVKEMSKNGYKYIQKAEYFIRKNNGSNLAVWCNRVGSVINEKKLNEKDSVREI